MKAEIVYRPKFYPTFKQWYAWCAKDSADAHKPAWARRVAWLPVTEEEALRWFAAS